MSLKQHCSLWLRQATTTFDTIPILSLDIRATAKDHTKIKHIGNKHLDLTLESVIAWSEFLEEF